MLTNHRAQNYYSQTDRKSISKSLSALRLENLKWMQPKSNTIQLKNNGCGTTLGNLVCLKSSCRLQIGKYCHVWFFSYKDFKFGQLLQIQCGLYLTTFLGKANST